MDATICTLYEGDYHFGVGALTNSLYTHGYRGIVWAGYRGALPPWAQPITRHEGYVEFRVAADCVLRFVPITTDVHLTNFKPDFMLQLWQREASAAERLFYFDPDIIVKCDWAFFGDWVEGGVALCEDVNSPMPSSHPIRNVWRGFGQRTGSPLSRGLDAYVNGGFIGMKREHRELLETWRRFLGALRAETGSLNQLGFGNRPFAFYNVDQDVLNLSLMACDVPISLVGQDGMDFIPGGYIMSHAIGKVKPWRKNMLRSALSGYPPSLADRSYWQNVQAPIRLYPSAALFFHKIQLAAAAAVGRFLRRA